MLHVRFAWSTLAAGALCAMVSSAQATLTPRTFTFIGLPMTLDVSGTDTHGSTSAITVTLPPHFILPAHVHQREDEINVVTRGHLRFHRGNDVIDAGTGSIVFFPRGIPHWIENVDNTPSQLTFTMSPAGLEKMFLEVSQRRLAVPRDLLQIVAIGKKYGITYILPFGIPVSLGR